MTREINFAAHTAAPGGKLKKLLAIALAGAFVGAFVAAAPAHAGVIDFEGYGGLVGHANGIEQDGYQVDFFSPFDVEPDSVLAGVFVDGSDPGTCVGGSCPVNNPTTYYAALDDSYLDVTSSTNRARFNIKSFDASFIGGTAPGTSYPAVAGLVRIQGFFAGGGSVTQTYQLPGPVNGAFNFFHYNTSPGFGQLEFVEAAIFGFACDVSGSCSAFSTDRGQFGIDNIQLAEVPEPGTDLMLGLGLFGLLIAARRRQA
jgi:hypothetical protein